jgi:type I restriction enzyme M protein
LIPKEEILNFKPAPRLDIDRNTFDIAVKNPNGGDEIAHRSPKAIMDEIAALDAQSAEVLGSIKALL